MYLYYISACPFLSEGKHLNIIVFNSKSFNSMHLAWYIRRSATALLCSQWCVLKRSNYRLKHCIFMCSDFHSFGHTGRNKCTIQSILYPDRINHWILMTIFVVSFSLTICDISFNMSTELIYSHKAACTVLDYVKVLFHMDS